MRSLKVTTWRETDSDPKTVAIPVSMLKFASKMVPSEYKSALKEHGMSFDQIIEVAQNGQVNGKVAEVENVEGYAKIVVEVV